MSHVMRITQTSCHAWLLAGIYVGHNSSLFEKTTDYDMTDVQCEKKDNITLKKAVDNG